MYEFCRVSYISIKLIILLILELHAKSQKSNQQKKKSENKLNFVNVIKSENKHNKNECWWLKKRPLGLHIYFRSKNLSIKMLVVYW